MANFNDLPDEASPALTDKVFTGRGAAAGAERKPTLQGIMDLYGTTTPTAAKMPIADGAGKIDVGWIPTTGLAIIPRAGTQAEMDATTLEQSELGVTTDTLRIYMGDGATPGNIHMTPLGYARDGVLDVAGVEAGNYINEVLALGGIASQFAYVGGMSDFTGGNGLSFSATSAGVFALAEVGLSAPLISMLGEDISSSGAQTIEKSFSNVIFAASATSVVVTSVQLTDVAYEVFAQVETNDSTMYAVVVTKGNGSFTLTAKPSAPTGAVRVSFLAVKQTL